MPTTYLEQFFAIDPSSPPPGGTALTVQQLNLVDQQDNGQITTNGNNGDRVDGSDIRQMYPGDTITLVMRGQNVTVTGVTFYLADGRVLFTPTDGTRLFDATFTSSTFVNGQSGLPVGVFSPPCFTPGTLIATPTGEVAVETLQAGDLVETMDHGPRRLRWTGRRTVSGRRDFAPVCIAAGVFGNRRPLTVSPNHRMLFTGWKAELLFGETAILVSAKHLVGMHGVTYTPREKVDYVHLLFDRHEIIFAEGAPTESFHPGGALMERDIEIRREIAAIFPEAFAAGRDLSPARWLAVGYEVRALHHCVPRSP